MTRSYIPCLFSLLSLFICNIVTLCRIHCRTLGLRSIGNTLIFHSVALWAKPWKWHDKGWQDPFNVARNQLFFKREYIRFQLCHHNLNRYQSYLVIALLLSVHKCPWTFNHSFPNGKNDLVTPTLSQSFQIVWSILAWLSQFSCSHQTSNIMNC